MVNQVCNLLQERYNIVQDQCAAAVDKIAGLQSRVTILEQQMVTRYVGTILKSDISRLITTCFRVTKTELNMSVQRATSSAEDALAGSICIVEGSVELMENRIAELYVSLPSSDHSSKPFTREAQNTLLISKLADTQRYEKLQSEPVK